MIKYKGYTIKKEEEVRREHYRKYDKDSTTTYVDYVSHFYVTGKGFRNRKFRSLEDAECAITKYIRQCDGNFGQLRKYIRDTNRQIKALQKKVEKIENWMAGR